METKRQGGGVPSPGLPQLLSVCRWGRRFYAEAAEVSMGSRQSLVLQNLELQRSVLAQELQQWVEPTPWLGSALIPLVRTARNDDQGILVMCERMDRDTIAAYELERARVPVGRLRALLDRHLSQITQGQARHAALRTAS